MVSKLGDISLILHITSSSEGPTTKAAEGAFGGDSCVPHAYTVHMYTDSLGEGEVRLGGNTRSGAIIITSASLGAEAGRLGNHQRTGRTLNKGSGIIGRRRTKWLGRFGRFGRFGKRVGGDTVRTYMTRHHWTDNLLLEA